MFIAKCTPKDEEQVMEFLKRDPSFHLFLIGDIENYGFESSFQEVWKETDHQGNIRSILLRYENNFLPAAYGEFAKEEYARLIDQYEFAVQITGKDDIVKELVSCTKKSFPKSRNFYFAKLTEETFHPDPIDHLSIKKAVPDDASRFFDLRSQIKEFQHAASTPESWKRNIEKGVARLYYLENEAGDMIASAGTTAENTYSAMVISVCTHPSYRGRGYASRLVSKLASDLLKEGKTLCLFYDNPDAGKIYKRLGYRDIGTYLMLMETTGQ
ncbi:MAG: GNAT family N-acetyltransferase [Bacillaceae bacterium]|nr:GNAT family N-acetyltransferase [Bacillaceae bacterium]